MDQSIAKALASSMSYESYRKLTHTLAIDGKTTGPNQSEMMAHFTFLNDKRMARLDRIIQLTDELHAAVASISQPTIWLVITEAWCGDAAQIVPVFGAMAAANPTHISMKLILRDEHLAVMDMFAVNGSRAIPKLVVIDQASGEVKGHWGARPAQAQQMVIEYKQKEDKEPYEEFNAKLQQWYNKDKTLSTQRELATFLLEL